MAIVATAFGVRLDVFLRTGISGVAGGLAATDERLVP